MRSPSERVKQGLPAEGLPKRGRKPKNGEAPDVEVVPIPKENGEIKKPDPEEKDEHTLDVAGELQDIWERRVLNPEQKASEPIRVKRVGMHLRWINLASTGRYQRARYEEGWQPVTKDQLIDEREIYGVSYTTEGYVCRGEKQSEMLMWMPEVWFKKILARKQALVRESNRKIKEAMQESVAKKLDDKHGSSGPSGEEIVARANSKRGTTGAFQGSINFGTSAEEPDAEALAAAGIGE